MLTEKEKAKIREDAKAKKPKKPTRPRDKTFGCPDWVEDTVIPMGERAAKLWRHLKAAYRIGGPAEDMNGLKQDWAKFSPHIKSWK